jgi:hypothetical protein
VIEHGMEPQPNMEKQSSTEKQDDTVKELQVEGSVSEERIPATQDEKRTSVTAYDKKISIVSRFGEVVNASGYRDQLQRQYGLLSICGLALTVDNAWVALGTSLITAISMR